jgi:hypothetical protein
MNSDLITYWDLPNDFVLRLFQTESWENTVKQKGAEALKVPKDLEYTVTRARYRGEPNPHQDDDYEMTPSLRDILSEGWKGPIPRLATKMRQSRRRARQKKGPRKLRKTHPAPRFRVEKPRRPIWLLSQISISRLAEFIWLSYDSDLRDLGAVMR